MPAEALVTGTDLTVCLPGVVCWPVNACSLRDNRTLLEMGWHLWEVLMHPVLWKAMGTTLSDQGLSFWQPGLGILLQMHQISTARESHKHKPVSVPPGGAGPVAFWDCAHAWKLGRSCFAFFVRVSAARSLWRCPALWGLSFIFASCLLSPFSCFPRVLFLRPPFSKLFFPEPLRCFLLPARIRPTSSSLSPPASPRLSSFASLLRQV